MRLRAFALLASLCAVISACIPPAPDYAGERPAPRIEGEPIDTMFDETPVWEDRPAAAAAGGGEGRYVVQPGDTGIAIARAHGVAWSRIVEANQLVEPFIIKVGQVLLIPTAGTTAAEVDTARAAAFRLDIDDIVTGGEPAATEAQVAGPIDSPGQPLPSSVPVTVPSRFSGIFGWPASGIVKQRFGRAGEGAFNDGIDIAVSKGAPVQAAGDGVVAFVGDGVTGYNGVILLRHGDGWISAYGRTARAAVTRGQTVKRGQTIGFAGTGAAPLLHFELRRNRTPVDPLKHLPAR